jgi:hypothetical protein
MIRRKRDARARNGSGKPEPHLLNKFRKNFAHSDYLTPVPRLAPWRA